MVSYQQEMMQYTASKMPSVPPGTYMQRPMLFFSAIFEILIVGAVIWFLHVRPLFEAKPSDTQG